ncbi:MAG: hypothetical protein NCW75_02485 [Phycisphaera sp.]|nr:MAG: hypothetical protein NCW75_02485 [Phycisphaera sp.]
MASRRPPLFELLQHQDGPRQGQGPGVGRPNALGHATEEPPATKTSNGHAQGAVETKPEGNGSAASTLEDLSEPVTKPKPKQPQARPRPTHVPAPLPEPARKTKRVAKKAEPKPERAAGAADWSGMHPKNAVSVKMMWIYGAIFAVLAIVVGVWTLGYNLGESSMEAELKPYLDRASQPGAISDPMTAETDGNSTETPPLSGIERQEERRQAEATLRTDPTPPVVEPDPAPVRPIDVLVDVRVAGNNYMKLASGMTRERAVGLAQQLSTNGVHAMAIDEGRQGFGLYTAFAVPSGQFSAMERERRELTARVVRLLGSTPQELGGPYTSRDQLWMRFDG